jgi:hypothetical protein
LKLLLEGFVDDDGTELSDLTDCGPILDPSEVFPNRDDESPFSAPKPFDGGGRFDLGPASNPLVGGGSLPGMLFNKVGLVPN